MTLLVAWLLFPLLLGLLALGCGLLLERTAAIRLPGPLVAPSGLTVVVVTASFATMFNATAELAVPAVVGLAAAGLAASAPWGDRQLDTWALLAAIGTFAAFAAPIIVSGQATFAGYITLDDTATWLALTDRVMEHGRSISGLPPSTYERTLANYLAVGSPVGANLPLGVGGKLLARDTAWLFQPYLAFLAAMLSLGLYALLAKVIDWRPFRALTAFVAAQPALLYAYSLWSGLKELAAAAIIVLLAALIPALLDERVRFGSVLPAATASAALLGVLTVGGVVWLAALLVPALAAAMLVRGRSLVLGAATFVAAALALSVPSLLTASVFLRHVAENDVFTSTSELGNLVGPLSVLQVVGIWPAGDFRTTPRDLAATHVLIGVAIAAAAVGLAWAWRRRAWGLLLYITAVGVGWTTIVSGGSPWIDAKALATGSPAFVVAGLTGAAWIFQRGRRVEAAVVAAAICGGVLWSNALAYRDVWLAPRDRLAELERIGKRFAGQGPTLMTEFQPYGVRHFLRNMDPEGASELRYRLVPLRRGGQLEKGAFADVDEFRLDGLMVYRTLVLARSPTASRPPSAYRLGWSGRFYEVWRRSEASAPILGHLSLGNRLRPAATPRCRDVLRLARLALGRGGRLAAVPRSPVTVIQLSRTSIPPTWGISAVDPAVVYPRQSGSIHAIPSLRESGHYDLWLGGSFRGRAELSIDGKLLGASRHRLNEAGEYTPFGEVSLTAGLHRVTVRYGGSDLHPGSGGQAFPLGPVVLSQQTANRPIQYVQPQSARSLCGQSLDWVEAVNA